MSLKRQEKHEMPSFFYPAEAGLDLSRCPHCEPWWTCVIEQDPHRPGALVVREWHHSECPVWRGVAEGAKAV